MSNFQYQYGDQPLAGYTIQRAAGRGGFGEVYYALSDSGREVALKVIQNYEQIELRGISQCMNLKSPHLVTIFDVKHNQQGKPFVVMEYVAGPSLHDLLAQAPGGLGSQKAAFFLREIAKGLSFLHECGIVHRDLKPGNIFYENGYVKIGDYGLSKAITPSMHSGQTITVGTVHYMAPEIGAGCYDRSIDIYALGILLYEMLTGGVPFFGASPAEILMKHLTAQPDLSSIEPPFDRVIRKALAKDPKDRYQTVQQMVEDVFGAEHIRNSVSHFSPESLSALAQHVAQKAQIPASADTPASPADPASPKSPADTWRQWEQRLDQGLNQVSRQIDHAADRLGDFFDTDRKKPSQQPPNLPAAAQLDPIDRRQRRTLAFITMAVVALGIAFFHRQTPASPLFTAALAFTAIWGASSGILWARWRWFARLEHESSHLRRLATGGLGLVFAALYTMALITILQLAGVDIPQIVPSSSGFLGPVLRQIPFWSHNQIRGTWLALGLIFCVVDWWKLSSTTRKIRVSLRSAVGFGFLGYIAAAVFGGDALLVIGTLAGTCLVVQIASPYLPRASRVGFTPNLNQAPAPVPGRSPSPPQPPSPLPVPPLAPGYPHRTSTPIHHLPSLVPPWAHLLWLAAAAVFLGLGLLLLIWGGMEPPGDETAAALTFGINGLLWSLVCLFKAFRSRFPGWYRYLVKPFLLLICLMAVSVAAATIGYAPPRSDDVLVCLFFIIFPAILFLIVLFVPSRAVENLTGRMIPASPTIRATAMVSPFKRIWALILSGGAFLGIFGLQRFYVGKIGTGILWFLTGGLLFIGQIIDVILIVTGHFKDKYGYPLVMWENENELKRTSPDQPAPVAGPYPSPRPEQLPYHPVPPVPPSPGSPAPPPPTFTYPSSMTPTGAPSVAMVAPFDVFGFLFASLGNLFVFTAFLLGLAVAVHLPVLLAAVPEIAGELNRAFGSPNWPMLLEKITMAFAVVLLLVGAVFIIIARRKAGPAHILRAALGLFGLFVSLLILDAALPGEFYWQRVYQSLQNHQIGPALETLIQHFDEAAATFAAVFSLVSLIILAWPPRRQPPFSTGSGYPFPQNSAFTPAAPLPPQPAPGPTDKENNP